MSPAQERLITSHRWWVPQLASVGSARYIVAVALIGAALLLCHALRASLGSSVPYLQFLPAILIAAWYGGLGPGVVATAAASLAAMYFFLPPAGLAVGQPGDLVSLSLFAATGLGVAWTNHQLRTVESECRAEAAKATERAERLDAIVNTTVDGIIVMDTTGTVEAFNRGAERLFGYPASDAIGRNVNMLMPAPDHEEYDTHLARHLATGVQQIIGTGREVTGLRRDGTTFPLHLSVGQIAGEGEQRFTGILHDLSARVRVEKQLREQTSLAKLGEMAAVIAHEVKNPLAGVRGAIQVIGTHLSKDSKDALIVGEIVSRIDGLNELMKDLLLFARPPQPKLALVDMETLVMSTAHLLRSDPAFAQVEVKVDGEPARVVADAALLKIVFVNLLVNAGHAMQGRGTIQVSLTSIAHMCQIAFRDEGPGIPADVLERIFTPFFTTKARGSGLGLPTVRRLIEAHHGTISIACPSTGGTVVTVQLPGERLAVLM